MRDQPLTTAEAASWLKCTEDEVQEHLRTGRLRLFQPGPQQAATDGRLSLNAVIVLAESLPDERRIFEVREPVARTESGSSGPRSGFPPRTGG